MNDASSRQHRGESASVFKGLKSWLRAFRRNRNGEPSLRETIEEIIEESETEVDEPITEDESTLLRNILQLRNLTAYDVMVPRGDIVAVPADVSLNDLVKVMGTKGHSRLPVYRTMIDIVIV